MKAKAAQCPVELQRVGKRIARILRRPEVFDLLPPYASDWGAGGCWMLARALIESGVFPNAKIRGVWNGRGHGSRPVMHHAVVEVAPNCYLDHHGVATKRDLLHRMDKEEQITAPQIGPWLVRRAVQTEIACPANVTKPLREVLVREFKR